ncbi:hypothetical protein GIB67_021309 [Kingdonia uniflora]|uniref:Uncharacterized protein n=1 Tax=Kingdonia uniflora TaxID=39325 RepID=A0A7J7LXZ1_9MAGN|nr:hypothetical protein GIB67_021309 [Kingdonia uniflora]
MASALTTISFVGSAVVPSNPIMIRSSQILICHLLVQYLQFYSREGDKIQLQKEDVHQKLGQRRSCTLTRMDQLLRSCKLVLTSLQI